MPIGDKLGQSTVTDLNQFVHSWLDDLRRSAKDFQAAVESRCIRIKGDFTVEIEEKEKS
jgi:hypothetical protein